MAVLSAYSNMKSPLDADTDVKTLNSLILSSNFVYYKRLQSDGLAIAQETGNLENKLSILYSNVKKRLNSIAAINAGNTKALAIIKQLADGELKKDRLLLKKVFQIDVLEQPIENYSKEDWKNFLNNINSVLGIKDVYARCVRRIQFEEKNKKEGAVGRISKITIAEFFPSYFQTAWKAMLESDEIWVKIEDCISEGVSLGITMDQLDHYLRGKLPAIIDEAISTAAYRAVENMLNSSDFTKKDLEKVKKQYGWNDTQAYREVLEWINQNQNSREEFMQTIYSAYRFDDFKAELEFLLQQQSTNFTQHLSDLQTISNEIMEAKNKNIVKTSYATGAVSEQLIQTMSEIGFDKFVKEMQKDQKESSYSLSAMAIGKKLMKSDVTLVFETSNTKDITAAVQQMVNKAPSNQFSKDDESLRVKNIEAHEELSRRLNSIDEGFIVYTNAKNYTLGSEGNSEGGSSAARSFKGFESGSDISLNAYKTILERTNQITQQQINSFIGAIANLGKGTIGAELDNLENLLEEYIASDIAYFLFDDVAVIGRQAKNKAPQQLHFMNLDGIFIPLSFLLYLVYLSLKSEISTVTNKAISARYQRTSIAKASIKTKPILYPEPPQIVDKEGDVTNRYLPEHWIEQRNYALKTTKVGITFLRNFREIVRYYLV